MPNASTGAYLYMPEQGIGTTLNLMIDNLTPNVLYVGVKGSKDTDAFVESVAISSFPSASSGSVFLGEKTPIFIMGGTPASPISIDRVYLANMSHENIGQAGYEEYDVTTLPTAVQDEAIYEEDGTFVIDDIIIQMTIVQN